MMPIQDARFTITIPAFNAEAWIAQAISSIMAQTFRDWSCVIVDDGSTDATGSIARQFASIDNRIKVISKKNGGTASALNAGLREFIRSRSDYFMWLSADDLYITNALANHNAGIPKSGDEFYFRASNYLHLHDTAPFTGQLVSDPSKWMFIPERREQIASFMLRGNYVHGNSFVLSRGTATHVGMFNERLPYAHDMDYWLRVARHTEIRYLDCQTCVTRKHPLQEGALNRHLTMFDSASVVHDFLASNPYHAMYPDLDHEDTSVIKHVIGNGLFHLASGQLARLPVFDTILVDRLGEYISVFAKNQPELIEACLNKLTEIAENGNYSDLMRLSASRLSGRIRKGAVLDEGPSFYEFLRISAETIRKKLIDLDPDAADRAKQVIENISSYIDKIHIKGNGQC